MVAITGTVCDEKLQVGAGVGGVGVGSGVGVGFGVGVGEIIPLQWNEWQSYDLH